MDLFSSLKTAYDSIGSEISKSFDSSDFEKHSTPATKIKSDTQPRAELLDIPALIQSGDRSHTHSQAHQPSESESVNTAPINEGNDFDTSWGQWEDTPTRNTPPQQENSSPPLVRTPPTDEAPLVRTPPTDEAPLVRTPPTDEAPLVRTPPTNEAPLVKTPPTNEATDGVPNKPVATSTPAKGTPSKGKSSVSIDPHYIPSPHTLTTYLHYIPCTHYSTLTTYPHYIPCTHYTSLHTLTTYPHYIPCTHTPSLHTLATYPVHIIQYPHYIPSLQLEALSREDLIKYIKKQAQLLQKSKAKCEGVYRDIPDGVCRDIPDGVYRDIPV